MKKHYLKPGTIIVLSIFTILLFFAACSKNGNNVNKPVTTDRTNAVKITSIAPLSGIRNSLITITGQNFDTTLSKNSVTIDGQQAFVESVTSSSIIITVPNNAGSGPIILTTGDKTVSSSSLFTVILPSTSLYANGYLEHIAIDASGNVYGDRGGTDTLFKITPTAMIAVAKVGSTGNASSVGLWGIAVDATGNIYETNSIDNKIYKITPAGIVSVLAGNGSQGFADGQGNSAEFNHPLGLAIDGLGNLYVNDNHRVRKITSDGIVSTVAGTGIDGDSNGAANVATFGSTEGIVVDAKGNIFVSDHEYYNIRKISVGGVVSTLAGRGVAGFIDGPGIDADFNFPQAMAIDASGNIFVSDNYFSGSVGNYSIRMVNQFGNVLSFLEGSNFNPIVYGTTINSTVNFPDGIAFDKVGNMYICNTQSGVNFVQSVTKVVFN